MASMAHSLPYIICIQWTYLNTFLPQLIVNETNRSFKLRLEYGLCLVFPGHGMELMKQYMNADTIKIAAIVIKVQNIS